MDMHGEKRWGGINGAIERWEQRKIKIKMGTVVLL